MHVRKQLWRAGLRYRLHARELPGKPDLVLPRWRVVVFVHGCFWHWHTECPAFRLPKTRPDFWNKKLSLNQERDAKAVTALTHEGWRVAVVWECAVRAAADEVGRELVHWIRYGQGNALIEANGQGIRLHVSDPGVP